MEQNKSKVAAGILGILLGSLGIHNFYLGYTKKAILQLCLTLGGYVLGFIGSFIIIGAVFFFVPAGIGIWGLVEGIMILTGSISQDANGNPLV